MTGLETMKNRSAITLFGGTGDLTYRKLLPALYNLDVLGKLDDNFKIIVIGRRAYTPEKYIEIARDWVKEYARTKFDNEQFESYAQRIIYFKMDMTNEEEYKLLQDFYTFMKIDQHVYYYAVAPSFFITITNGLKKYCASNNAKVIIEKPFGENLEKAAILNDRLAEFFGQEEIYHIDHYLGKEMIQNILSLRFKNVIFKGIWNKDFIENIQITAAETVGVGTRASYYDKSGALKDMVQNHLLQVLSIVAMEEPTEEGSKGIHISQYNLLSAIKPIEDVNNNLIMGQYIGYLDEANIDPDSKTETYAALKLFVDNERWENVPFFIRTGKRLGDRQTQVVVQFKAVGDTPGNVLIIKIQPDEGVYFQFNAKKPGTEQELQPISLDFCQSCILENRINTPEAYERLLGACLVGDRSLFSQWDQIVVSWEFINNLLEKYHKQGSLLHNYEQGSMGPIEAEKFVNWIN
ncbi:glucose-6-phosphate dehydrogenase [Gemella cuniculi]|uniref:glucose-6-phosphate dehydrogenase n=1 Tax=Gemella cuniculi TaxID=150240 RepID=UPI0003F56B81|nr:glucose-6-phosphate dehydrogenase [Gemella cuniculi]